MLGVNGPLCPAPQALETTMTEPASLTMLLTRWREGDVSVEQDIARAVYPVLLKVAHSQVRKQDAHLTWSATDLAQEAYLRLREQQGFDWQNRQQFFAIAATVVRRVIIDYLRERTADKRSGGKVMIDLESPAGSSLGESAAVLDWIALDQALTRLSGMDAACGRVVELKLFTPMSADEIAEATGASVATVGRHWRFARNWLAKELDAPELADVS